MVLTVSIAIATCIGLILLVFLKPTIRIGHEQISIYWLPPLLGALALIFSGVLSAKEVFQGLTASGEMNPLKILILFFSMTLISIFLDCAGFFRYLAEKILRHGAGSQKTLFFTLYLTVSILTVFTSNDIIVLTFTPFICYFTRHAKIDPLPYLFCEFIAANTWSMLLIIGNPTNIYLATGANISFFSYLKVMALPTFLAGGGSLLILWLLFSKKLKAPICRQQSHPVSLDRPLVGIGLAHLGICILFLILSSYISLPMWTIALMAFCSLYLCALIYLMLRGKSRIILRESLKRTPLEMAPFIISMFVLVLGLEKCNVTAAVAELLSSAPTVTAFGTTSFLSANLMNNIPMSVLFSEICGHLTGASQYAALYASVIGSNLGAFFTPLGALAGIMWMQLLSAQKIKLSFARFTRFGAIIAIPTLIFALLGLILSI